MRSGPDRCPPYDVAEVEEELGFAMATLRRLQLWEITPDEVGKVPEHSTEMILGGLAVQFVAGLGAA